MKKEIKGKFKYILYLFIIFCFITGIFTLKDNKTQKIVGVEFEPVTIDSDIKETAEQIVKNIVPPPRTHDFVETVDIEQKDAELLLKVAMAEGGSEGIDGMWLIMSVIMNRVNDENFPDSVKEVVYQESQFSTVSNGAINKVEPSSDCHLALARLESGQVAEKIVAFETTDSTTLDEYFSPAFTYRHHQFYTEKH